MPYDNAAIDAALALIRRSQLDVTDVLRRIQGDALEELGFGPSESPYEIVASGPQWRLRDYGAERAARALLIVAAPIKRPYIWDLSPSISAVRYCLKHKLHVYLLEWMPASRETSNNGIEEYSSAIAAGAAHVSNATAGAKPYVIGHSLGGTLAGLYAALAPASIRGLVLLGAPLCFQPQESQFRDTLVSLMPSEVSSSDPFAGSVLSYMSAYASPGTFIWSRLMDAAFSVADSRAMDVHARIERWALDEVPLPGKLVSQIVEWLYRENRFCRGTLQVGKTTIGPSDLSVPTIALVNTADAIAPLASVKPVLDAIGPHKAHLVEYPGELGVCLQHLAILVGQQAYADVWPKIIAWLNAN